MNMVAMSCFEFMSSDLQKGEFLLLVVCLKMIPTRHSNIHILFAGLWQQIKFTHDKQKPVCERQSKCRTAFNFVRYKKVVCEFM